MYFVLMLSASFPYRIIETALFHCDSDDKFNSQYGMGRKRRFVQLLKPYSLILLLDAMQEARS